MINPILQMENRDINIKKYPLILNIKLKRHQLGLYLKKVQLFL